MRGEYTQMGRDKAAALEDLLYALKEGKITCEEQAEEAPEQANATVEAIDAIVSDVASILEHVLPVLQDIDEDAIERVEALLRDLE